MSPRYFYGFKPVKKNRRVPLSTTVLLSPRDTHSSFVGASLCFDVKLNRERARDPVVPRLRLKEVRRSARLFRESSRESCYRRLLAKNRLEKFGGSFWRILRDRFVIRFVFRYGDRNSSTRESLSQLKLRIPNAGCSSRPRTIF